MSGLEFGRTFLISVAGLRAQGQRMRVIAQNLANADSLPRSPDQEPYRRKVITFGSELDRARGVELVRADRIGFDGSEFEKRYDPGHPGADEDGYVQVPNVNSLIEAMDMREAGRTYEANLNVVESVKRMLTQTIDLLK